MLLGPTRSEDAVDGPALNWRRDERRSEETGRQNSVDVRDVEERRILKQ